MTLFVVDDFECGRKGDERETQWVLFNLMDGWMGTKHFFNWHCNMKATHVHVDVKISLLNYQDSPIFLWFFFLVFGEFNYYRLSAICAMSDTLNKQARLNQKIRDGELIPTQYFAISLLKNDKIFCAPPLEPHINCKLLFFYHRVDCFPWAAQRRVAAVYMWI